MSDARVAIVRQLIAAAQDAVTERLAAIEATGEQVSADELISVYVSLCNHALTIAKKHGAKQEVLLEPLRQMMFELAEPKGRVM